MTATKYMGRGRYPRRAAPPFSLTTLVLPVHPWVIEVGERVFSSLAAAESYARTTGDPIYCRIARKETNHD